VNPLSRPPLLRAGSLAALRLPSVIAGQIVTPVPVDLGPEQPAPVAVVPAPAMPAEAAPEPIGSGSDNRTQALRQARQMCRQHGLSVADLVTAEERAAAIAEVRSLIDTYSFTADDLFGR